MFFYSCYLWWKMIMLEFLSSWVCSHQSFNMCFFVTHSFKYYKFFILMMEGWVSPAEVELFKPVFQYKTHRHTLVVSHSMFGLPGRSEQSLPEEEEEEKIKVCVRLTQRSNLVLIWAARQTGYYQVQFRSMRSIFHVKIFLFGITKISTVSAFKDSSLLCVCVCVCALTPSKSSNCTECSNCTCSTGIRVSVTVTQLFLLAMKPHTPIDCGGEIMWLSVIWLFVISSECAASC